MVLTRLIELTRREIRQLNYLDNSFILPPIDMMSKCFEIEYTVYSDPSPRGKNVVTSASDTYERYLPLLYTKHFIYYECSPFMLEKEYFALYTFLCQLDKKSIYWHVSLPCFDFRLKEFFVHEHLVHEAYRTFMGKKLPYLNVYNYIEEC